MPSARPYTAHEPDIAAFLAPIEAAGPITVAVMVSSIDGRVTVGGRVGGLTGPADQQLLLGVREAAAAIVIGGSTKRAEGYDKLLGDDARQRRLQAGLPPEPELIVFTREISDLRDLWRTIRERHPDGLIVCEGGPTLLGLIVEHQLLDQLVLCISPLITGDDTQKRLLEHTQKLDVELELLALASADSFLFLRYGLPQ